MPTQAKRYKTPVEETHKERQLSSLFSIISNNLLIATEVLSTDYKIEAVQKLESLSRKARILAKELMNNPGSLGREDFAEKISFLKRTMLELVVDLTEELSQLDSNKKNNEKAVEDLILARRLLRESQRGLITIQD
ncbi:MAG: hypothetical protein HY094_06825 [Candidatus Melainabacteria bacterium]|nr:hypothetical protein [Candidatus Melainabacteria bacterium]